MSPKLSDLLFENPRLASDLSLSKEKCILLEVGLVLQGRAEVVDGHAMVRAKESVSPRWQRLHRSAGSSLFGQ